MFNTDVNWTECKKVMELMTECMKDEKNNVLSETGYWDKTLTPGKH